MQPPAQMCSTPTSGQAWDGSLNLTGVAKISLDIKGMSIVDFLKFLAVEGNMNVAIAQDVAILAPIVVALWLVRVKALAGLSSQLARGHHPSQ